MTRVTPLPRLAALIAETLQRNQWTDRDVARRATAQSYNLTKSDISNYRTLGMQHINPEKVQGLAAGLQLPAYRVMATLLSDFGIDIPMDIRTPEDAIAHDHTLSANTRESVLLLLERDRANR
jgi:hypothetical protein